MSKKLLYKSSNMAMPSNIYYWWNFGSLLGFTLISQILTGFFLSMFYENNISFSFDSINQINRNTPLGWLIRSLHANGASMFFIFIYLHISRSLFFKTFFFNKKTWNSGVMILLLMFMTAFLGYVLPWGQMSFWGATVITNLLSSIPYIGNYMTFWLWGNFSVSKPTLMRFFSLHFILPMIMIMVVVVHIILLHSKGSNNPTGINSNMDKISFNPAFIWKDLMGVFFIINFFLMISLIFPYYLMDPDNFIPANPLITPPHIQPEWYFLFAYAILRTIPNKLGGVMALLLSIFILLILPFMNKKKKNMMNMFLYKTFFMIWSMNFAYLTIMGSMMIEQPFISLSKLSSLIYFSMIFIYL